MMKSRLRYVIASIVATLVFVPVVAFAVEDENQTSETTTTTTTSETKTEDAAALKDRLEKKKTELKIKLTNLEQEKIKTRCKAAQGVVTSLSEKVKNNGPNRTKAYTELVSRLTALIDRLKAKGVDVTELQQELAVLQTKIDTFNTDLAAYKQALSDLKNVDCSTDPTAFKAALEASRAARDKLIADAADIKAYVKDTIKPTLEKIRAELKAQETAAEPTSTSEGSN